MKNEFNTAIDYEASFRYLIEKSNKRAWLIAFISIFIAIISIIAVVLLTPLKTIEPYVIRVDNTTGMVDILTMLDEKDGGGYFARYKDFPYIMGDGENEIEALKDLKEAFKGALEVMLEKGDYIKEPIDNEAKIRINITLPKSLVEAIDTISDNRSKFLADLANSAIKSYKIST
ncbi:hypothetical protein GKJ49_08940 [Campylobacter coli]|nr:hypothetical protein [Campylobacter coli]